MVDKYINELIKELELAPPPRTDSGAYVITFDELDVEISEIQGGGGYFFAVLGPLPETNTADFLADSMNANLFGQGTDGAVLALSEDYKTVILTHEIPLFQNYIDFRNKLEDFLNTADFWTDKLKAKKD